MVRVELNDLQRNFSAVQLRPSPSRSQNHRFSTVSDDDDLSRSFASTTLNREEEIARRRRSMAGAVGILVPDEGSLPSDGDSTISTSTSGNIAGRVTVSGVGLSLLNAKDSPLHR